MTFAEIQTEVLDRLGMTSSTDSTRIGRAINRRYREITTSLGIKQTSRLSTSSEVVTIGSAQVVFSDAEKVLSITNRNVSPYRLLEEVTIPELRSQMPYPTSDSPTQWAVVQNNGDSVAIHMNVLAATAFTLYGDIYTNVVDLSGSNEPIFSESYHDILISATLVDELLKLEKPALATIENTRYEKRMGELRHWYAVSLARDIRQGKNDGGFQRNRSWMP